MTKVFQTISVAAVAVALIGFFNIVDYSPRAGIIYNITQGEVGYRSECPVKVGEVWPGTPVSASPEHLFDGPPPKGMFDDLVPEKKCGWSFPYRFLISICVVLVALGFVAGRKKQNV